MRKKRNPKTTLRNKGLKKWRIRILESHNYTCELCGGNWKITAHHFYFRSSAIHLLLEIDNGICLCGICHSALHWMGKDQKLVEDKIVRVRGQRWLNRLKNKKENRPKSSFLTLGWYEDKIKQLEK
jgi:hypothetical protein